MSVSTEMLVKVDIPSKQRAYSLSHHAQKKLAVVVPFRDRFEELLDFIPHMHKFLNDQGVVFEIFVMQQRDGLRFNRASLINVGYLHTRSQYDYIAMHDVDLLPINKQLRYDYPESGPSHLSAPELHPKYHYATFIGGILLITNQHFQLVNGLSNRYWGWGLEDDEFYLRLKEAGLSVRRPQNITTGQQDTFKHLHDSGYRRRDTRKCHGQREATRRRDRKTGLADLAYNITGEHVLTVAGLRARIVDVALRCDRAETPWCLCQEAPKKNIKARRK